VDTSTEHLVNALTLRQAQLLLTSRCLIKRDLASGFQAAASWQASSDSRHSHQLFFQKIDKVICGRFTFDIGGKRKNNLRNLFSIQTFEQFLDPKILGTNMIERRNSSSKRMVSATESARLFQGKNVGRLFDNAEQLHRAR